MDELEQLRINEEKEILEQMEDRTFGDWILANAYKLDKDKIARVLSELYYYAIVDNKVNGGQCLEKTKQALVEYSHFGLTDDEAEELGY